MKLRIPTTYFQFSVDWKSWISAHCTTWKIGKSPHSYGDLSARRVKKARTIAKFENNIQRAGLMSEASQEQFAQFDGRGMEVQHSQPERTAESGFP